MAVASVVFNGTRVNTLDNNSNVGHWVGSGGTPAAEAQNAYQNGIAVNKKVTASVLTGIDIDPVGTAIDMTAAANKLCFVKVYVADFGDVDATFGVSYGIGSANNAYYKYNLAGSGAKLSRYDKYPEQGGYILTAIDPNIAAWRDAAGSGSPSLSAVDWIGAQCNMIAGNAKSENFAIDSVDIGTGLTITAGDGGSTEGNFTDFATADSGSPTIRWGCCRGSGNALEAWCLLTVGTASITEFLDTDSVVTFKDGYHSAGLTGVAVGMSHASSVIQIDSLMIGEGTVQAAVADDTRPDFVMTGTSGTFNSAATMRNFRNITFTNPTGAVDGANIECQLLTQGSQHIQNTTIYTNALTTVACLVAPTLGTSSGLHDSDFIQSGVGHAIEITATGTHNLQSLGFSGYGGTAGSNLTASTGAADAAIYNNSGGAVTLNINGTGDSPSIRNAASSTTTVVSGAVTVQVKVIDEATNDVQNAKVLLRAADATGPFPYKESVTITRSGTTATVAHTGHGMATDDKIQIKGATDHLYNKIAAITVTTANEYTYTMSGTPAASPASGTILATFVALEGLSSATGIVSTSRTYSSDQPITGWARKSTTSPYYKQAAISADISSSGGLSSVGLLILDGTNNG